MERITECYGWYVNGHCCGGSLPAFSGWPDHACSGCAFRTRRPCHAHAGTSPHLMTVSVMMSVSHRLKPGVRRNGRWVTSCHHGRLPSSARWWRSRAGMGAIMSVSTGPDRGLSPGPSITAVVVAIFPASYAEAEPMTPVMALAAGEHPQGRTGSVRKKRARRPWRVPIRFFMAGFGVLPFAGPRHQRSGRCA